MLAVVIIQNVMKNIYDLEIHETVNVSEFVQVVRVPGGWVYNFKKGGELFIPYNNEFQIVEKVVDTFGQ